MDDETVRITVYRVAMMGSMTWFFWPAAMSAAAFWCWHKTRLVGALIMAVGFVACFGLYTGSRFVPISFKEGSGDPELVYGQLHTIMSIGATTALVVVFVGFVMLCASVVKELSVKSRSETAGVI